ncbi:MAG: cytochrome P450 [Verrucomicrobia bacterium]|nr:cytochrome P450 [Verrucomicrobiota bacterium]
MQPIPNASLLDNVAFNLLHTVPYFLRGIFTKSHFWSWCFNALHTDALVVRLCQRLRAKYGSDFIYLYLLQNKALCVFDYDGIKHVLDNSPFIYADPDLKRRGMSHFQPNALTISRGEEWKDRRRFNEAVLNSDRAVHEHGDLFLEIIRSEVNALLEDTAGYLGWKDFDQLFKRITLQLIFGTSAREESELTDRLERMMQESNRVFLLKKSKDFDPFYERIRAHLAEPAPGSLSALCPHAPSGPLTRQENQVPHWMFAAMETLATNALRTLATIVAHPKVEERIRLQLAGKPFSSAAEVVSLKYLRGCLQEAMRLWPTTPMLGRLTVSDDQLGGRPVPANTQVIILNTFLHRDSERHYFANRFSPDLWLESEENYYFNHLSNGRQACAGKNLVLFVGTAVLIEFLRGGRYRLRRPALRPAKPLPHTFNEFRIKLERIPLY